MKGLEIAVIGILLRRLRSSSLTRHPLHHACPIAVIVVIIIIIIQVNLGVTGTVGFTVLQ